MSAVLKGIDVEWRQLARSPQARRALMRWKAKHAVFEDMADFDALLTRRQEEPDQAPEILAALAALAPGDELAARVLLQALVPGLIHLSRTAGYDDREALNEMIGLAWERIATYPPTRHGAVAANVLLDVRKRYRHMRELDRPRKRHHREAVIDPRRAHGDDDDAISERIASEPSAEDAAMQFFVLDDLVAAHRHGVISEAGLGVIVQTRVLDRTVSDLAAECHKSRNTLMSWRFRAERRLREMLLAG